MTAPELAGRRLRELTAGDMEGDALSEVRRLAALYPGEWHKVAAGLSDTTLQHIGLRSVERIGAEDAE